MISLSFEKLSAKDLFLILATVLFTLGTVFCLNIVTGSPLIIAGTEFGFKGSNNQKLATAQQEIDELRATANSYREKIATLEGTVASLQRKIEADAKQSEQLWFPVADIKFRSDNTYTIGDSAARFRGKWIDKKSGLEMSASGFSEEGEIVVSTNLPPPADGIRLEENEPIRVPLGDYFYAFTLVEKVYSYDEPILAKIRIARQPKLR